MQTFDAVIPYLKNSWKRIALGIFVLVIVDGLQVLIPKVIQKTIDNLGVEGFTQNDILKSSFFIILLVIGMIIMRFIWRMLIVGNSWIIERGLRQKYYDHLLLLSRNFFNKSKIGDLMALATNDLNAVRMLFGMGFIAAADIILMTAASFAFMATINLRLTLFAIIPMPLITIVMTVIGPRLRKRFHYVQETFAKLSGMIQESISGVRVIKAFAQEKPELEKMEVFSKEYVDANIKSAKVSGFFHPLIGLIISFSLVIVLIMGGHAAIKGEISIGEFIAFFSYLGMLVWPMIATGFIVNMYQRGTASLNRLNEIWDTKPEIYDEETADFSITELNGNIEVKDLTFKYTEDGPTVLEKLNFVVERGKTLAICGRTASGKSTVVDLLVRVYNPPKNAIYLDGHEIYNIPLETLRRSIVMVPQDVFLFSDTIANNIALGKPDATIDEIHNAAKYAAVYNEILEFDQGFETVVGERGVTLSGGQKQRVAIARSLIADPDILVLDDALSAVDTGTENQILNHLINVREGKTTIIIAHRISALHQADKIIVLQDQTIAESGSHDELLALNGAYRDLYEKQKIEERLEGKE
ncbi:MAG: ABC transporter ATP-binding protein [Candidatus Cloacimonadales bacterium]|jgi:ATP-binding cassette subfamily B protein|nr:ABC transporter ATP-binding protein/permease [Candidatus Cloacimonadota bacterium]MDD2649561.1 ABC transporter ATP-binding protein [Candidatus Cloacimonadota bacterium]MDX9977674.1 ABC transporter ATP-binding protein [Candidatus Cloacimonadales bacterium]